MLFEASTLDGLEMNIRDLPIVSVFGNVNYEINNNWI